MIKTSVKTNQYLKVLALILGVGALPLVVGLTGCTTGSRYQQSTGEYIDDHSLSSQVKKALGADPQFKYDDVNVVTFKGVVQLSGFVNSKDQKSRAGELARGVESVKEVQNNITVKENTGDLIDDRGLSSLVKKALGADPQYKYDGVNVVTYKGVVQLSGFVNTKEQKTQAGEVARQIPGTKAVENNISVKD